MSTEVTAARIKDAPLRLIAARIRQARRQSELTLDRLGEIVGTSRHHLIRLEKGDHRPREEMLTRIAEATGKPVDFFLVEEVQESGSFPADEAA